MTAEIVIMNRSAIALAADSAGSLSGWGQQKVFSTCDKLFALSHHRPVAIMFHGHADFMEVPVDTLVSIYRQRLGKRSFSHLEGYTKDFLKFIGGRNPLFPAAAQKDFLKACVGGYYRLISSEIGTRVHTCIEKHGSVSAGRIAEITDERIRAEGEEWKEAERRPGIGRKFGSALVEKYRSAIAGEREAAFGKLPLSRTHITMLDRMAGHLFTRCPRHFEQGGTGVVIAGYGDDDQFPAFQSLELTGIVANRPVVLVHEPERVTRDENSAIFPFAQTGMVELFLEGLGPAAREHLDGQAGDMLLEYRKRAISVLDDAAQDITSRRRAALVRKLDGAAEGLLQQYREAVEEFTEHYSEQFGAVVGSLSKADMAYMAEMLVNLTSFKRKVTMASESVGGPVDVAVISRGDGLVWVKKKSYFHVGDDPEAAVVAGGGC